MKIDLSFLSSVENKKLIGQVVTPALGSWGIQPPQ